MVKRRFSFFLLICYFALSTGFGEQVYVFDNKALSKTELNDQIIQQYSNDTPLSEDIKAAAISESGETAILLSLPGGPRKILVYSEEGKFLYGYISQYEQERGYGVLWFDSNGTLIHRFSDSKNRYLNVFDKDKNSANTYLFPYSSYETVDPDREYNVVNGVHITYPETSKYVFEECTSAVISVRNTWTNETRIMLNLTDVHMKRRERENIKWAIYGICLCIFVYFLLRFLKWTKDKEK